MVLLAASAATWASSAAVLAAERPNFLVILIDDLGPEWLSCYGSEHRTPQIDRLAREGLRFSSVWATPLCTPTRHELLTGRYPFRTGWTTHHDTPRWGGQYFDWQREVTFARVLRSAGYATAMAGKWQVNDLRAQPEALKAHGFDEHCVWPGSEAGNPLSDARYFDPYIQENGPRGIRPGAFGPDVFTDFTIDFMRRHRDRPFVAYHPMVLTHTPFTETPENRGGSARKQALFPGMVDYADRLVGRMLAALDELKIRERTVVILMADNGSAMGLRCRAAGRTVVGGKGSLKESGIQVPLIVSWPGHVAAAAESGELVDASDLFPTILELAGAPLPQDRTIDGISLAPVLLNRSTTKPRRQWIYSQLGPNRVVRDLRFKLGSDGQFYDLQADPAEAYDLAKSAEPEAAAARGRLEQLLKSLPADAKLPFGSRSAASRPAASGKE